jgi:hypothetical protein
VRVDSMLLPVFKRWWRVVMLSTVLPVSLGVTAPSSQADNDLFVVVKRESIAALGPNARALVDRAAKRHPAWARRGPVALELRSRADRRLVRWYLAVAASNVVPGERVYIQTKWEIIRTVYRDTKSEKIFAVERVVRAS